MATLCREFELEVDIGDFDICDLDEVFDMDDVKNYVSKECEPIDVFTKVQMLDAIKELLADNDATKEEVMQHLGLGTSGPTDMAEILTQARDILYSWSLNLDGQPAHKYGTPQYDMDVLCKSFWENVPLPEDIQSRVTLARDTINFYKRLGVWAKEEGE